MFGWFRKRQRPESAIVDAAGAPAEQVDGARAAAQPAIPPAAPLAAAPSPQGSSAPHGPQGTVPQQPVAPQGVVEPHAPTLQAAPRPTVAAPSLRPAMPLSDHPNFAGLGLAQPDLTPPRLLEPEAVFTDEARDELNGLLLDMFGPRGRYRLEWRTDRQPGDDAMFSQIMVADLVRRIQNTVAEASELELRAAPLPLAIEAAKEQAVLRGHVDPAAERDEASDADVLSDEEREAAIAEFLQPSETLEELAAATHPDESLPHHDTHEVEGDRRIA